MASIKKKLVVVGDSFCGKTCILLVMNEERFLENPQATVFDNTVLRVECDGQLVDLQMWDTAGQEGYNKLRKLSYMNTDIFVMCYSIAEPDSLANIKHTWVTEVRQVCPDVPILLVGNKKDLRDDPKTISDLEKKKCRPVTTAEGCAMAEQSGAFSFIECSAKTGLGIKEVLMTATRAALRGHEEPTPDDGDEDQKKKSCCCSCCR